MSRRNELSWQYNGTAPLSEILNWADQHIQYQFLYNGFETIVFLTNRAYVLFLLRWQ